MTTTQDDSFAAGIAADFAEEVLAADALLCEIVQANRQPNYSELVYFQKHLNWDESAVKRERRRVSNVLRDKSIAGSPADRQAAIQEAATASDVLAKEGPKVAEQIAKLESKLRSMESDAKLSAKRCEDQALAVERLRGLCPQHIADSVRHRRSQLDHSLGREIADINSRVHELQCCLTPEKYPTPQEHIESLHRSFPDAVLITVSGGWQKKSLSPAWPSIRTELETELAELTAKLEPLRERYAVELAAIEAPLNYYANGSQTE